MISNTTNMNQLDIDLLMNMSDEDLFKNWYERTSTWIRKKVDNLVKNLKEVSYDLNIEKLGGIDYVNQTANLWDFGIVEIEDFSREYPTSDDSPFSHLFIIKWYDKKWNLIEIQITFDWTKVNNEGCEYQSEDYTIIHYKNIFNKKIDEKIVFRILMDKIKNYEDFLTNEQKEKYEKLAEDAESQEEIEEFIIKLLKINISSWFISLYELSQKILGIGVFFMNENWEYFIHWAEFNIEIEDWKIIDNSFNQLHIYKEILSYLE